LTDLVRLSFSIDVPLAERLEKMRAATSYENRSEFIRDLIRDRIVSEEWENNEQALGTITILYDHTRRNLAEELIDVQHSNHAIILATTHVHLDRDLCAEMIMVKGAADEIRRIADLLRRHKGVLHGSLSLGSTGGRLAVKGKRHRHKH